MKKIILILAIVTLVLLGCTGKQEVTKQTPAPQPAVAPQPNAPAPQSAPTLNESDLEEIEDDEYYSDDLDKGIEDLMEIENAS